MFERGCQAHLINGLESLSLRAERGIQPTGGRRDGLQRRLVEPGFDEAARIVLHESAVRVCIERNEIALRRAHADGVDLQGVLPSRCLSGDQCIALEILSVGDQYENFIAAGTAPQRSLGFANGARYIGAAARNGIDVDRAQRLMKRAIVEGDGAYQEGAARKGHQSHRIPVQLVGKAINREFGSCEPIGLHIRRRHAARRIHRENDFVAAPADLFPAVSHERSRQCKKQRSQCRRQQRALRAAAPDGYRLRELYAQVRRDESCERSMLTSIVAAPQPEEAAAGDESDRQPPGIAESHGNLRKRVCCSSKPNPRMAADGISAQEYSSS